MILKLLKYLNRELIHLLRTTMLKKLLNQSSSKLIQVNFNIMLLQLHKRKKLNKMKKLINSKRNQLRKVLLNLNGNKSNNKVKPKSKC